MQNCAKNTVIKELYKKKMAEQYTNTYSKQEICFTKKTEEIFIGLEFHFSQPFCI